ncbi:MAG: acetolactate decarboxylase [Humidesulfovibrio sp.]|nr:acetolactate decarboxylase [Humidesulfovibrio sp.]
MRRNSIRFLLGSVLVLACWSLALAAAPPRSAGPKSAELVQVGVIDALLAGGYDGSMSLGELRRQGDFGLGTFDALDGEMVVLDGVVYQVLSSGQVRKAPDNLTTPFAQVTRFAPDVSCPLTPGADLKAVEASLNTAVGDANCFAAVRLDAVFETLTARSVPRQSPPYRPLAEVAKEQAVFHFTSVRGTLVGLRGPAFVRGLGVPGWHWHFLTRDRLRGGHVLTFVLSSSGAGPVARLERLRRMELLLPERGLGGLDLGRDRAAELKAVESGK